MTTKRYRQMASTSRLAAKPEPEEGTVEFKLAAPDAHSVFVAGSFNGWDPRQTPLRRESGGVWRVTLPLSPGRYEYRFVVDGQWREDPAAKETVPNPHGGRNSVLTARSRPQPAMAAAE
ncbi:MAG TPA: glycogen-binding domain-containing protein [Verrucomicrobiae bacterium]|nr:glycogen-binding domain-containing protein [Verrucomicrobiae bacterium]